MHLWPSTRIRDSFKIGYLKKLEWNLHRMNTQKQQHDNNNNQQSLMDGENENGVVADGITSSKNVSFDKAAFICREILMVLTCCYCCFCCGACVDQDED